jgi:hypothetical protein
VFALESATLPVLAHASDVDAVCGKVLSQSPQAPAAGGAPAAAGGSASSKLEYCKAAKSAEETADANSILWKVWAGVAAVCTYACVASFVGGPTNEYVCVGAQVAGGVVDAVISKEMSGAMMAIASAGGSIAINQGMKPSAEQAAKTAGKGGEQETQKDIGACIGAATATLQAVTKHKTMSDHEKIRDENLDSARAVQDDQATAVAGGGYNAAPQAQQLDSNGNPVSGGGGGGGGNVAGGSNDPNSPKVACGQAKASGGNSGAFISCALAADKNMPGFVRDPRFAKNFQRASGESLDDFFGKNHGSPNQAMMEATGGVLNSGQSARLSAAIAAVPESVQGDTAGGTYSSGGAEGGGGGGESGGMDPAMAALMAQIAGMLNPEEAAAAKKQLDGVNRVHFATQKNGASAVSEDKTLSIFDRIAYRYIFVGKRMIAGGPGK